MTSVRSFSFLAFALLFVQAVSAQQPPASPTAPVAPAAPTKPVELDRTIWVGVALNDAGFEAESNAGAWRLTQHTGVRAYRFERVKDDKTEGKQSMRVTRTAEQVYGSILQAVAGVEPGEYRLSADLKVKGVDGKGWSLKASVFEQGGAFEVYDSEVLNGDKDWQRVTVSFKVPQTQAGLSIGATLRGGGVAWIDNVRLERKAR